MKDIQTTFGIVTLKFIPNPDPVVEEPITEVYLAVTPTQSYYLNTCPTEADAMIFLRGWESLKEIHSN